MAVSLCMRSKFACPQVFLQFCLNLCDVDSDVLESSVNSTLRPHFRTGSDIALQPLAGVLKQGYQDCLRQERAHGQQGADVPLTQKRKNSHGLDIVNWTTRDLTQDTVRCCISLLSGVQHFIPQFTST